eukprot:TRINITY_DN4831_c0_g1_i1.p1 TRINITY_DN4831_c0_g1~~TRINITY_DN4831_c0_g1_i1.p1  ORF type:complete len:885 (+),score=164.29 TRINITY_DN4831_c0_g1_i1:94-2748(+)
MSALTVDFGQFLEQQLQNLKGVLLEEHTRILAEMQSQPERAISLPGCISSEGSEEGKEPGPSELQHSKEALETVLSQMAVQYPSLLQAPAHGTRKAETRDLGFKLHCCNPESTDKDKSPQVSFSATPKLPVEDCSMLFLPPLIAGPGTQRQSSRHGSKDSADRSGDKSKNVTQLQLPKEEGQHLLARSSVASSVVSLSDIRQKFQESVEQVDQPGLRERPAALFGDHCSSHGHRLSVSSSYSSMSMPNQLGQNHAMRHGQDSSSDLRRGSFLRSVGIIPASDQGGVPAAAAAAAAPPARRASLVSNSSRASLLSYPIHMTPMPTDNLENITEIAENFDVLSMWATQASKEAGHLIRSNTLSNSRLSPGKTAMIIPLSDQLDLRAPKTVSRTARWRKEFFALGSAWRICWDAAASVCIIHGVFAGSLHLVGIEMEGWLSSDLSAWLARTFWTLDFILLLCAGEDAGNSQAMQSDDMEEPKQQQKPRRWRPASWRCHRLLDLLLLLCAWVDLWPASARSLRVLSMFRFLQVARCQAMLQALNSRIASEKVVLGFEIAESSLVVVGFIHFVACCWLVLGRRVQGWNTVMGVEASSLDQCVLAYHFATSQIYGSSDVNPTNVDERIFSIFSQLLSFLVATAFVSSVTSSITRLHIISGQQGAHQRVLRKYLQCQEISAPLAERVQQNARQAVAEQQRNIPEFDVELLKLVSEPLRTELHLEMYAPVLDNHPLFELMMGELPSVMRQICHAAVETVSVSANDIIFSRGEVPREPKMIFVRSGSLLYTLDHVEITDIPVGDWVTEHVLWTNWVYHGTLWAQSNSRLLLLDAAIFQKLASASQTEDFKLGAYGTEFLGRVNAQLVDDRTDLGSREASGPGEEQYAMPGGLL